MARMPDVALVALSVGTRTVTPVQSSLPERDAEPGCSQDWEADSLLK